MRYRQGQKTPLKSIRPDPMTDTSVAELLTTNGLRPTAQRLAIGELLFGRSHHHISAERLHEQVRAAGVSVSLATVYNTLHQFTAAGLLRQVVVDSGKSYFDTNVSAHHHYYFEDEQRLQDIPADRVQVLLDGAVPFDADGPEGTDVLDVNVVVRVGRR